ncbi:MAG: radical SAM protein [Bacteriovoracaceae bacterium]|nr:radical SAM protein [Bacteriovoracaceae bacterium]
MKPKRNTHYHDLDHSHFLAELGQEAFKKNIPLFTTLELSQDCNFKCHHCYNFDRTSSARPNTGQTPLTFEEWKNVIDQVMDEGAFYICFTGGEVFLYPRLWELIDYVNQRDGIVKLKSNGALLTQENVERLIQHKVSSLEISLYGMSEESYRSFTGKSGMFAKTIDGIKRLNQNNISLILNIILHRLNFHELQEMIDFSTSQNIPYNFSDEITKRYDDTDSSLEFNLTDDQYRSLLRGLHKEFFQVENDLSKHSFQCSCARNVCGISFSGDIFPCIGAPVKAGNFKTDSFKKTWNESSVFLKIRSINNNDFKECVKCDVAEFCNRSSGSALINTNNYYGCDPTSLRIAKLRKDEMG